VKRSESFFLTAILLYSAFPQVLLRAHPLKASACRFIFVRGGEQQQKSRMANHATRLLLNIELEGECQRHLYLPGAADGMGYIPQAGGAIIEARVGLVSCRVTSGG
jgi:hypothetical protein